MKAEACATNEEKKTPPEHWLSQVYLPHGGRTSTNRPPFKHAL